ncbi:hypothetical protein BU25DRAFT_416154 [Macroventuria anomochaeta]|uniref:Uncharacterized protein n=1 Tax=Macroventuria anomochaeta TaxID=301207 RepID=A0ACB6RJU6_9PLEO|nr:uncharacterized protein BU25DRAFT_416154 [Macroventuria anomochaeta]KAF2621368.1 hypothetical protein BU25DRAFT_416154 [Macroventuria anomochaeta]
MVAFRRQIESRLHAKTFPITHYHNAHSKRKCANSNKYLQTETMSNTRDTNRDMRRLASLYNGVAFEQMRAMCWDVLVDHYLADDGFLEISAQVCQKPEAEEPLFGSVVSESMKRTFVSINKCVAAIVYNSAWLAFCVEGKYSVPIPVSAAFTDDCRIEHRYRRNNACRTEACSQSRAAVHRPVCTHKNRLPPHHPPLHPEERRRRDCCRCIICPILLR